MVRLHEPTPYSANAEFRQAADQATVPVILNGAAGGGADGGRFDSLEGIFSSAGLRTRRVLVHSGSDLREIAAEVALEKPSTVVAGGGDGTISAVASVLAGTDIALGVLPLGTLNHFARDLGIPLDVQEAARVIAASHAVRVDVAEVNGRVFLNNSSLGLYPHIVRRRENQQRRLGRGKWPALLWATLTTLRRTPFVNVRLCLDDAERQCTSSFVFIGNNEYMMEGFNIGLRERLDAGRLSLYLSRRQSRARLIMLALRALIGRLHQADDFEAITAQTITVDTPHRRLHVAIDGEVDVLDTPLEYAIRPRALKVLVPVPAPTHS